MKLSEKYLHDFFGKDLPISGRLITCLDNIQYSGKLSLTDVWRALENSFPEITNFYSFLSSEPVSFAKKNYSNKKRLDENLDEFKYLLMKTFSGSSVQNDKYMYSNPNDIGVELIHSEQIDVIDFAYGILCKHRYSRTKSNTIQVNHILQKIVENSRIGQIDISDVEQFKSVHKLVKSYFHEHPLKSKIKYQQFSVELEKSSVRVKPIGAIGYSNNQIYENTNSVYTDELNVIHPIGNNLSRAIRELEQLINKNGKEQEFQDFFEIHPDFLLSLGDYSEIHPQVILTRKNEGKLIPDFFLKRIGSDLCDICDIKRPVKDLIRNQNNRVRFRDALMEGIAQLRTYRDYFEEAENSRKILGEKGITVYKPKIILVIGKETSYNSEIERTRLEADLPRYVDIKTYDDILNKMRFWQGRMKM